jgi:hypothetical protein
MLGLTSRTVDKYLHVRKILSLFYNPWISHDTRTGECFYRNAILAYGGSGCCYTRVGKRQQERKARQNLLP